MKPETRRAILGILLTVTVVAALWPAPDEEKVTAPRALRRASTTSSLPPTAETKLPVLDPLPSIKPGATTDAANPPAVTVVGNLFPAQTWKPPAAPQQASATVAPPLPFAFGGRYVEAGKTIVFLKEGERIHSARVGDTINSTYRIDAIEPANIQLTYLPLKTRQSLPTGSMTQ